MAGVDQRASAHAQAPLAVSKREPGTEPTLLAIPRETTPGPSNVMVRVMSASSDPDAQRASAGGAPARTWRLPAAAVFSALGLLAATGVVCLAVRLRSPTVVTTLEQRALAEMKSAPLAAAPSATPDGTAAAAPAADSDVEEAAPEPEPPPVIDAPTAALESAQTEGVEALTALSLRYPKDPAVRRALVLAHASEKGHVAALQTAGHLFELAPEETSNDEIRQIILRSANAAPEIASVALDLMAQGMGGKGADLLYEVVTVPSFGKSPRDLAGKLLLNTAVRKVASPAVLVADDLRRTSVCPSKPLIARAREQGDLRALHYIHQLLAPQCCGKLGLRRCIKCGGVAKDLRAAASAIEKRRSASAASAASAAPSASASR